MKPFIRWAGGKTWLLPSVKKLVKNLEFNNYYEPFIGGGAIFFGLDLPVTKKKVISDKNERLIKMYNTVQQNPEEVIDLFKTYDNSESTYYRIRDRFNLNNEDKENAAQFIYLNQFSYNGIFRVNKVGDYNVPYGFRKIKYDVERIRKASDYMINTIFLCCDFAEITNKIEERDLIFLDPPYAVNNRRSSTQTKKSEENFLLYNKQLFCLDDQIRLKRLIDVIKERGAYYILTNAYHPKILEIFRYDEDYVYEIQRKSLIGGKYANRDMTIEYLFTNIRGDIHEKAAHL